MELLLEHYQIEAEGFLITIYLNVSKNKTEKVYLSIKDKEHPILKLHKNLLYLGDPFVYLESLKMWKKGNPVHFVEIIAEFENYLLEILGLAKSNLDLKKERAHILKRAREYLVKNELGKASYLYDYAAELSVKLGEDKIADAYRKKIHKLQLRKKGQIML